MKPASGLAETYGNPGPEGPQFWGFLAAALGLVFLVYVTSPLWNHQGVCA